VRRGGERERERLEGMNSWRSWFHHLLDSCEERFPPPCLLAVALVLLSADLFLALTSYIKFSIMHAWMPEMCGGNRKM